MIKSDRFHDVLIAAACAVQELRSGYTSICLIPRLATYPNHVEANVLAPLIDPGLLRAEPQLHSP